MEVKERDYNGIYGDMVEILGEEVTYEIWKNFRGQQISCPMRLYSKEYTLNYLQKHYNGKNLRELSRQLGYSERWIKQLIQRSIGNQK